MRKVIIADDDFLVRTYLKKLLPWEELGFRVVGEAKNGEDALELAAREQPELIITDICMPIMDGIALIRELRARGIGEHILVLSSHDDFSYVREAMKLGIDDYLLKDDLKPDNIRAFITEHFGAPQVADAAGESTASSGGVATSDGANANSGAATGAAVQAANSLAAESAPTESAVAELARIGQARLLGDFFLNFMRGSIAEDSLEDSAARAGVPSFALVSGAFIELRGWRAMHAEQSPEDYARFLATLKELGTSAIARIAPQAAGALIPLDEPRGRWGVLLLSPEVSGARATQELTALAQQLATTLRRYFDLSAVILTTTPKPTLAQQLLQWQQLVAIVDGAFYLADGIHAARDLPHSVPVPADTVRSLALAGLTDVLTKYRPAREARTELIYHAGPDAALTRQLVATESLAELRRVLAAGLAQAASREGLHPAIARALDIIELHYSEPLTQPDVATAVNLKPAYFSALFKKNVGEGFSRYLAERRLAAVKQELRSSTARIADIATAAGFDDYPYFCRLFKQLTGLSPQEYRKNPQ